MVGEGSSARRVEGEAVTARRAGEEGRQIFQKSAFKRRRNGPGWLLGCFGFFFLL